MGTTKVKVNAPNASRKSGAVLACLSNHLGVNIPNLWRPGRCFKPWSKTNRFWQVNAPRVLSTTHTTVQKPHLFAWAKENTSMDPPLNAWGIVIEAFIQVQQFDLAFTGRPGLSWLQYGVAPILGKQWNLPTEWQTMDWDSDLTSLSSDCFSQTDENDADRAHLSKKLKIDAAEKFRALDVLPIRGRDVAQWNRLLCEAQDVWSEKIRWWQGTMNEVLTSDLAFEPADPCLDSHILYGSMVLVLREIRHVNPKIYSQAAWRLQIKDSGFAEVCAKICRPENVVRWQHPHIQDLLRKNRIQDSVRLVLRRWTPPEVVKSWIPKAAKLYNSVEGSYSRAPIADGQDLINALLKHETLVPRASYPQAVYFALSLDNFTRTWNLFMGAGLYSFGYDASRSYTGYAPELKSSASLRTIFQRTRDFKKLKQELQDHAFRNKLRGVGPFNPPNKQRKTRRAPPPKPEVSRTEPRGDACPTCCDLPAHKQCVEYVPVCEEPVDESLIGCAITFAPEDFRLAPVTPKKSKKRKDGSYREPGPPPPVYLATDPKLRLRFIQADPERIKRCGQHIVWIVDQETKCKVKPLVRGQQFNYYSYGKMFAFGTRPGAGGGEGDALRMYEGIAADTVDQLNCMFNYAEESLILTETTRAIYPDLGRDMQHATEKADRLGLSGCHLFKCFNFTSPIHSDHDRTVKSICAQIYLRAKKWEYAFVRLRYRLCVRSQTNTLWSFNGEKEHCSLPPSSEPLTDSDCEQEPYRSFRLRGGAAGKNPRSRASVGYHQSAPAKSIAMAEEYNEARQMSEELAQYWDGDVE
ncbi:hypothetical protein DFH06DRAFT_1135010 [Mycena polygramma]|nr:hypothetical protein DFH06DRAFT_1135010 [Mycena polygramma]